MSTTDNTAATPTPSGRRRRFLLLALTTLFILAAVGYGIYYFVHGRWFESTEDAYANGNVVEITPQVAGTVVEIGAADNMLVAGGQPIVKLDPNDSAVALQQAEAALARTVRQVRGLYANVEGQSADLAAKEVALAKARADLERRRGLDTTGAIAKEEIVHLQSAVEAAQRAVDISREQLTTTRALIEDTSIATHPEVKAAAAAVRKSYLDYARSTMRAPVAGYVTQRSVQVGQRVSPGMPLMAVVPLDQLWVDANFKETQLQHMRIGQPVEVRSDLYGSDVVYHGRVDSLGIGTGSAMSLLPAQNATGNWIKIVQRIPVRIALDPKELREHPLRVGLSMHVEVNMHDRSGPTLAQSPPGKPVYATDIYAAQIAEADVRIGAIVRSNLGVAARQDTRGHKAAHT